jgi:hypothetical protein
MHKWHVLCLSFPRLLFGGSWCVVCVFLCVPFTMLHLDIMDSVRNVGDALDHMTHTELIHGGCCFLPVVLLVCCLITMRKLGHHGTR